ncbi:hypothetical protein DWW69_16155 [Bacteroides sp. AF16-49]|nr:hypothetical protein DWW69_16155 [Bacteroides sp. AF16-49]
MDPINYIKAYGVEQESGDLLYRKLFNGNYMVVWQTYNNIDIFLCKWLPNSHEDIDESCIIDKIRSFDNENETKVAKFKQMLRS